MIAKNELPDAVGPATMQIGWYRWHVIGTAQSVLTHYNYQGLYMQERLAMAKQFNVSPQDVVGKLVIIKVMRFFGVTVLVPDTNS